MYLGKRLKVVLYRLLTNRYFGYLLRICNGGWIRNKNGKFNVDSEHIDSRTVAKIWWGFYEKAEVDFVRRYLDPIDTIELGSSIGVVSGVIAGRVKGKRLICIEANPHLQDVIALNVLSNGPEVHLIVESAVLSANTGKISFDISRINTDSKVVLHGKVQLESIRLSDILEKYSVDRFNLVCDIEGSEGFFIFHDSMGLEKCEKLIIELHDASFLEKSIEQMYDRLLETGFRLLDRRGNVFAFEKTNSLRVNP